MSGKFSKKHHSFFFALLFLGALTFGLSMPTAQAQEKDVCKDCQAAIKAKKGGWCSDCKVGYVKGLKTKCKSCFAAIQKNGWCSGCKVGYVNGKKTKCLNCFKALSAKSGGWCSDCKVGYAKGLKTKCKSCFAAIQKNGTCPDCKVSFKDGKVIKREEDLHKGHKH